MIRTTSLLFSISALALGLLWTPSGVSKGASSEQRPVRVAVIDTGADLSHPALKGFLWTNKKEIPGNGVDDDQNGLVDDVHGWDFARHSAEIVDLNGHGTHVAGLIAESYLKANKNSTPLELMVLRYTDQNGKDAKRNFIQALEYAIEKEADVINISASGRGFSRFEFEALKKAYAKGIQVVVATGNKRPGTPDQVTFPASYQLENIHPVAALDTHGEVLASANLLHKRKMIFAPGENLYSALPGEKYGRKTGTSQATALVSGRMAAFLANRHPGTFKLVSIPTNTLHN